MTSPVMVGENICQNDNNDWSPSYRTTSDKRLASCNKVTGKLRPFVKCLFASKRRFPVILTYHCTASFDWGSKSGQTCQLQRTVWCRRIM